MPPAMFGAFGEVTSTTASSPDVGVPPLQLAPFAQSLDTAPVQSVASADGAAPTSASAVDASSAAFRIVFGRFTRPPRKRGPPAADRQAESMRVSYTDDRRSSHCAQYAGRTIDAARSWRGDSP